MYNGKNQDELINISQQISITLNDQLSGIIYDWYITIDKSAQGARKHLCHIIYLCSSKT